MWFACAINLTVGLLANAIGRKSSAVTTEISSASDEPEAKDGIPPTFVVAAAALVGFCLCVLELVWYRMLGPLLGGTVFTFGLILGAVLAGIGAGSLACARIQKPTLALFAGICAVEAVCVGLPYAIGDRLAITALGLRSIGELGFAWQVLGWSVISGFVVLPAAFVSGMQFPLLVGLLGRSPNAIGRDIGRIYAWNTVGSIAGSLAGGFVLVPALGALGTWRLVLALLIMLGLVSAIMGRRTWVGLGMSLATSALALFLMRAEGPTAAWRHSGIGAGRSRPVRDANDAIDWANERRRDTLWETDGRESSIALDRLNGLAFVVNGKSDGAAREDAATAVMSGVLGVLLHPKPARAMVIGLGTGSTAGWIAAVSAMKQVDVAEIEPAILEVARRCAPVNQHALDNPKVRVTIGDAREALLTGSTTYDLVVSEPSNPYRAGIASLFTRDFYEVVHGRLAEDGLFLQWVQGYEIDPATIRSLYATFLEVFPEVSTWILHERELLLVGSKRPLALDAAELRRRLEGPTYRSALENTWRTTGLEGLLSHYVGGTELARRVAAGAAVNTDDKNLVEFQFARSVGNGRIHHTADLREIARRLQLDRPVVAGGPVDWERVEDEIGTLMSTRLAPRETAGIPDRARRASALRAFGASAFGAVRNEWKMQPREPIGPVELLALSVSLAELGDEGALQWIDKLRAHQPIEADIALAILQMRRKQLLDATATLARAYRAYRSDPWPDLHFMTRSLDVARELAMLDRAAVPVLLEALSQPFAVYVMDGYRQLARVQIASNVPPGPACVDAHRALEPHVPWSADFLRMRHACYSGAGAPEADQAQRDLERFMAQTATHVTVSE